MTKLNSILLSLLGIIAALSVLLAVKTIPEGPVLGSAPSGLQVQNLPATSTSLTLVLDTVTTIFEARNNCASRVISTDATTIRFSVGSTSPSTLVGLYQAANTTVTYDGGLYGCGQWRAWAAASSTITTAEFF